MISSTKPLHSDLNTFELQETVTDLGVAAHQTSTKADKTMFGIGNLDGISSV